LVRQIVESCDEYCPPIGQAVAIEPAIANRRRNATEGAAEMFAVGFDPVKRPPFRFHGNGFPELQPLFSDMGD